MRRRKADNLDSLELLLDTVCNMFGGVIFIAILLALLAGKSGAPAGPAEESDLQGLREEVKRVEDSVALLLGLGSGDPEIDRQITSLLAERASADERLKRATEQRAKLAQAGKSVSERKGEVESRQRELEQSLEELESRISAEERRRVLKARLPVESRTTTHPFHLVIQDGRVYELYRKDGTDGYREPSLDVELDRSGLRGEIHRFHLKEGGGFPAGAQLSESERWQSIVARCSRGRHHFSLIVRPSGYAAFRDVRDAALMAGFEYNIFPIADDEPIVLSPASVFFTQ